MYLLSHFNPILKQVFVHLECFIKMIKCKEKVPKMQSTFGAWMTDVAWLNQSRYWVADHFSGDLNSNKNSDIHHRLF